ncbi:LysR family transcriptional regulator [Rouxiella aceris]|jgi:DNA-binding transcriptional LysR family regulator|nr:LysR family transcriptional regulator [Rouxiella aceris]
MDLKRMRYFCTIVEQGSISHAARVLNMAQPPLSKRLQELEAEVGAPLFDRSNRAMVPTEAGVYLYQNSKEILNNIDNIRLQTLLIASRNKKTIRIGISYLFLTYFSQFIHELTKRHPDIEINISVADSSHLEFLLVQRIIDIALIQKPKTSKAFEFIDMGAMKLVAVIAKSLMPTPPGPTITLESMISFPLILLHRVGGNGTFEVIMDILHKYSLDINIIMQVSEPRFILELFNLGVEAATLLPVSEVNAQDLDNYHVIDVDYPSSLFMPVVVRLAHASGNPAMNEIWQTLQNSELKGC